MQGRGRLRVRLARALRFARGRIFGRARQTVLFSRRLSQIQARRKHSFGKARRHHRFVRRAQQIHRHILHAAGAFNLLERRSRQQGGGRFKGRGGGDGNARRSLQHGMAFKAVGQRKRHGAGKARHHQKGDHQFHKVTRAPVCGMAASINR